MSQASPIAIERPRTRSNLRFLLIAGRVLLGVVFLGHVPDVAGPRPPEDANRLRVAIGDPGQQKARVPSARAGPKVISLHEHRGDAGFREVVHEADSRDAAADDQDIGTIGQLARIGVRRPRPVREARAHDGRGGRTDGWIW